MTELAQKKITDAEWQFDHQRLTIYFTAPQRVDFRELVKDLRDQKLSQTEIAKRLMVSQKTISDDLKAINKK